MPETTSSVDLAHGIHQCPLSGGTRELAVAFVTRGAALYGIATFSRA